MGIESMGSLFFRALLQIEDEATIDQEE